MTSQIKDGQVYALNKLMRQFAGKDRAAKLYIVSKLIGREVESTKDLLRAEWNQIRDDAYPHWLDEDWTVGEPFKAKCDGLFNRYNEEVLGQLRMF